MGVTTAAEERAEGPVTRGAIGAAGTATEVSQTPPVVAGRAGAEQWTSVMPCTAARQAIRAAWMDPAALHDALQLADGVLSADQSGQRMRAVLRSEIQQARVQLQLLEARSES